MLTTLLQTSKLSDTGLTSLDGTHKRRSSTLNSSESLKVLGQELQGVEFIT